METDKRVKAQFLQLRPKQISDRKKKKREKEFSPLLLFKRLLHISKFQKNERVHLTGRNGCVVKPTYWPSFKLQV